MEKFSYRIARNGEWEITENGLRKAGEVRYKYRNAAYARLCELNGWQYDLPTEKQVKYLTFLAKDAQFEGHSLTLLVTECKASRKQVSKLIDDLKSGRDYRSTMSEFARKF